MSKKVLMSVAFTLMLGILPANAAKQPLSVKPVNAKSTQKCVEFYTINGQFYCANKSVSVKPSLRGALLSENNKFSFDGRAWNLDWWNQDTTRPMLEYVLKPETVNNWTEMVTSQFFPGLQSKLSPSQLMAITIEELHKRGFNPKVNLISQSAQSVLFEWKIENHPSENQYELQRIISEPKGLHLLHYASRPVVNEDKRVAWVKILSKATPK